MKHEELAGANFTAGFNCAQSVCAAYAEQFGVARKTALKMAAGFGGGIGRMAGTCGAVTGAIMILGLQHGAVEGSDKAAKEYTYAQVKEFARRFVERNQTMECRQLLGCDLSTPEGHQYAAEHNLFKTRCMQLIQDAAIILADMLP
jgi:C_GCAxxG_C_C family probable redox protein